MSLLEPGQSLQPGHSLSSENGRYSFWMQTDGNVVLYDGSSSEDGAARWATNTGPGQFTPRGLDMQTDGNLVLYDTSNQPRWASGTSNHPGAFLDMQDDGNVVVVPRRRGGEHANDALWATGPYPPGRARVTGGFIPLAYQTEKEKKA